MNIQTIQKSIRLVLVAVCFFTIRVAQAEETGNFNRNMSITGFTMSALFLSTAQKMDYIRDKHVRHEQQAVVLSLYTLSAGDNAAGVVFANMASISHDRKYLFLDYTQTAFFSTAMAAGLGGYFLGEMNLEGSSGSLGSGEMEYVLFSVFSGDSLNLIYTLRY